jgi:glycosyltransferase involved in cell wall biosynthesis
MKIGLYTPQYPGVTGEGGIATYTRNLAQALSALGHTVHVLTAAGESRGGQHAEPCNDRGVMVHQVRADHVPLLERVLPGSGANYRIGAAMQRLVRRYGLEVVEFPNWEGLGLWFAALRKVPLVVRLHTSSAETQLIDGVVPSCAARWDVRRERWQSGRADRLVTHSLAHRQHMAQELAMDAATIDVIPHGIPVHPEFQRPARRPGDELTVVYLGRMEKRKGTLDLIHAIPAVLRQVPDVRFVLIGADRAHCPGGRTHAQYIQDELPPETRRRIRLMGRLPDDEVDRWLQTADVFVAPSLYESFGLIFLEAMRWGTPVIGTRAGGIPEIVHDADTGVLVGPGRAGELGAAILGLLRDEGRRQRLGQAGRRCAEQSFAIERIAARVANEVYERAIGEWKCQTHWSLWSSRPTTTPTT